MNRVVTPAELERSRNVRMQTEADAVIEVVNRHLRRDYMSRDKVLIDTQIFGNDPLIVDLVLSECRKAWDVEEKPTDGGIKMYWFTPKEVQPANGKRKSNPKRR